MKDILFIDKPKGMSSFDCIRELRKKLGIQKMGHAGTLDPLASGLLIVGVGEGTQKLDRYNKLSKRYTVDIKFGESRTTGDMEGEILKQKEVKRIDRGVLKQVLWDMMGVVHLPVPKYSAIKQNGEALYKKARRGEDFEPPVKRMGVLHTKLLFFKRPDLGDNIVTVRFEVESGAYVRSIVEEIGRRMKLPAVTYGLRRTKVGNINVNDAWKLADIQKKGETQ